MRTEAKELGFVNGCILSRATKANPSFSAQHKSRVPHPCDVFLPQGWDTTNANPHRSFKPHPIPSGIANRLCQLLAAAILTAPILRAQQPPIPPTPSASNAPLAI